jgi:YYY domain-containing protein
VFAGFVGLGALQYARPEFRAILKKYKSHIQATEIIFFALTLLFLAIRFFNSEIYWGEKPMDSTFLHFFTRNESLPPQDPWAAGSPMRYYYLGVYIVATLLKLTGIPVSLGYNFIIATLAGFIGTALYSVLVAFLRHIRLATACALFIVLSCNPEVLRLLLSNWTRPTFDNLFWPSSRAFVSPGFFEYTSWSLLFADLHAHVIGIPFCVCILGFALHVMRSPSERYSVAGCVARGLTGIGIGALSGINTWDFLSFGAVVALLLVCAEVPDFWEPPKRKHGWASLGERVFATGFARLVAIVWDFGVVGAGALCISHIFQRTTLQRTSFAWGWVTESEFNSFAHIFGVVGFIALLAAGSLWVWLCRAFIGKAFKFSPFLLLGGLVVAALVLAPMIASLYVGQTGQSWGLGVRAGLIVMVGYVVLCGFQRGIVNRALFLLLAFSTMLILALEHFYLFDRANTLFKGYMAVWMVGSITAAVLATQALHLAAGSPALRVSLQGVLGVVVVLNLVGFAANVYSVVTMKRIPRRVYTLDGDAYLRYSAPEDYQIIQWFNERISGTPVILEAQGASYGNFTRIAMHTGLPTVLGWEYHVQQRGVAPQEVEQRKEDVVSLYTSNDATLIQFLVNRYAIDFVVVGKEERETYSLSLEDPFAKIPGLFTRVATFAGSRIYVTSRSQYKGLFLREEH